MFLQYHGWGVGLGGGVCTCTQLDVRGTLVSLVNYPENIQKFSISLAITNIFTNVLPSLGWGMSVSALSSTANLIVS